MHAWGYQPSLCVRAARPNCAPCDASAFSQHSCSSCLSLPLSCRISQEKKKKYEPPVPPPRVGKKQRKRDRGSTLGAKLPTITPNAKCRLRLLKLERVKDWLLMEEEFVANQERLKPQEERNEEERNKVRQRLCYCCSISYAVGLHSHLPAVVRSAHKLQRCVTQVDELRGSPLQVGTLDEIIDEK